MNTMREASVKPKISPPPTEPRFLNYLIFGGPAALIALVLTLTGATDLLRSVVLSAVDAKLDPKTNTVVTQVSYVLPLLMVVLAYFALAGFGYAFKMRVRRVELAAARRALEELERAQKAAEEIQTRARREVEGSILAVDQIVNRLYEINRPRWRFTKVVGRYAVGADGSADVEMLYHIEAGPNPAQVWKFDIAADDNADAVEWLDELDLRVESLDRVAGKDVRFLLFRNSPRGKKIAIFFLPEIVAGESRKVRITYRWPKLAGDLIKQGRSVFEHSFKTCDPADCAAVSYTYLFAPELGSLNLHPLNNLSGLDRLERIDDQSSTMTGWTYSNPRLAMEGRKIAFAVARVSG